VQTGFPAYILYDSLYPTQVIMNKLYKNVFVIDDSKEDILLIKEAFKDNELIHKVSSFLDSTSFIEYAETESLFLAPPDLILLDLKMPKANGITVTNILRKNERFRNIPIVILSGTEDQNDIYDSYNSGANIFIKKPSSYDEWVHVIKTLDKIWLE
jgi:CheY-like chemotaxis protein